MRKRSYIIPAVLLAAATLVYGGINSVTKYGEAVATGSREYGEVADSAPAAGRVEYEESLASLVDEEKNVIVDFQGSMVPFLEKLARLREGGSGAVNILHVGDSHVQAGFWDSRMREHFSRDFGDAGRGVVLPHRLTGTNEPRDYFIRTHVGIEAYRTTANPSGEKLGFTGTGIFFSGGAPEIDIWHKGGFDALTVHHHPMAPFLEPADSMLLDMQCTMGDTEYSTTYYLDRTVDTLRLTARFAPKEYVPLYYGFTLHGGATGVMYHAVGANSAAFEHFERQTTLVGGGADALFPDLIIISLGTNNCFGRNYRSEGLRTVVERFFDSLASAYPGIPVLVTTPRESCSLSGGRRVPNPNIEDAAGVIIRAAAKYGFASWDLYNAAGGRGIAEVWYERKLSGRDRIHLTESGYNLLGDMFYDAILKYYNDYMSIPEHARSRIRNLRPESVPAETPFDALRRYSDLLASGDLAVFSPGRT